MPKKLNNISEKIVTSYIYWVIAMLVSYMMYSLITWVVSLVDKIPLIMSGPKDALEDHLLHTIAFSIILVKAYMILVSYAKYKHVSIKYIVEISIIACAIEIIFNAGNYEFVNLVTLWSFWIINLIIYMFFYSKFESMEDE